MRLAAVPLLAFLAACAAERAPEPAPTPTATVAAPRTLVAADFDPAMLGARVVGMEVTDAEVGDGVARVSAFVACEKEVASCDPARLPADTIYTYVLTITPAAVPEPSPSPVGAASDLPAPVEAPAELVRTTRAVPGFNGAVGFGLAQAQTALGAESALTITLDRNQLIWRVAGGSGWTAGKAITVWWQSTRPPAKPAPAYLLEFAGKSAEISAPFPAVDTAVER